MSINSEIITLTPNDEFIQEIYNICIKHGYVIEDLEKILTSKVYGNMDEVLNFKIVKYKPVPSFLKRIKNRLTKK